ncbi:MAG TPA: RNA polymerase sigma factor [Oligoflexus sp.]|uniref:RNA polymerase sigma factor n=1 Tax=Oligoflexus sp. TaxID=1971216 RepID=UPI002D2AF889|nr:RNA polymerase sigma factor [Oligoflexus sp.]HYX34612.1 RNA polymerase sigma factor [Oligoflexus sp.]
MASIRKSIEKIYRSDGRRVFASLVRILGDFDFAEEVLQDAFAAALEQWSRDGIPANPSAWLISAGKFKAIDAIRRRTRFQKAVPELLAGLENDVTMPVEWDEQTFKDDQLRLVFTCCHPALAPNTQVALTLREICGLTTEEIASAFLSTNATIAQRIVRGKAKIRDAKIPYQVPARADLVERLDSVLSVIYLVFNEGYSASSGQSLTRSDLSNEAIRLGRLVLELLPDPEVMGLLALMLLHESRREARTSADGDLILLEDQNRDQWQQPLIQEGMRLVEQALASHAFGSYTLQAAISAVHAQAPTAAATDWSQIVALYDVLMQATASPVVELNRAVALAMRDGPMAGIVVVDDLIARGELVNYHLIHAARADFCRRMGRNDEARKSYEVALSLAKQEPERRFLDKRLKELG